MLKKFSIQTLEQTQQLSEHLAAPLTSGTVIYLHGQLGAGKTTFTRYLLQSLGYQGKVKSPTYTLVEEYATKGFMLYHFDLYRIADVAELQYLGLDEYFNKSSTCVIEWPQKGYPLLPGPDLNCYIEVIADERNIQIEALTECGQKIMRHL